MNASSLECTGTHVLIPLQEWIADVSCIRVITLCGKMEGFWGPKIRKPSFLWISHKTKQAAALSAAACWSASRTSSASYYSYSMMTFCYGVKFQLYFFIKVANRLIESIISFHVPNCNHAISQKGKPCPERGWRYLLYTAMMPCATGTSTNSLFSSPGGFLSSQGCNCWWRICKLGFYVYRDFVV